MQQTNLGISVALEAACLFKAMEITLPTKAPAGRFIEAALLGFTLGFTAALLSSVVNTLETPFVSNSGTVKHGCILIDGITLPCTIQLL